MESRVLWVLIGRSQGGHWEREEKIKIEMSKFYLSKDHCLTKLFI